jgi:hypothetical protein
MELIVSVVSIQLLPAQTTTTKKSTDQRKPFGCAITRFIFPSEHKHLPQHRESNRADKTAKDGIYLIIARSP